MGHKRKLSLNDKLEAMRESISDDRDFNRLEISEVAHCFQDRLRREGYTCEEWEDTKNAARDMNAKHGHITVEDWKECIDWCFSSEKFSNSFWGKVPIVKLQTVIKIFPTFKNCRDSRIPKKPSKLKGYGKI